jgi:hypothetical protein
MPLLLWEGLDRWRAEVAEVHVDGTKLRATGTQLGSEPVPYRLDYALETGEGFVTRAVELIATGGGWRRQLHLHRDDASVWHVERTQEGAVPLPEPASALPDLGQALDCDIEDSALTNTMPVRRHELDRQGVRDFVMAFITVPGLDVRASPQRYEHLCNSGDGSDGSGRSTVRYSSRGGEYTADLQLDSEGFVELYPGMARRVSP